MADDAEDPLGIPAQALRDGLALRGVGAVVRSHEDDLGAEDAAGGVLLLHRELDRLLLLRAERRRLGSGEGAGDGDGHRLPAELDLLLVRWQRG